MGTNKGSKGWLLPWTPATVPKQMVDGWRGRPQDHSQFGLPRAAACRVRATAQTVAPSRHLAARVAGRILHPQ